MKIAIIGAGNVAANLIYTLKKSGFEILQVVSKTLKNAQYLAEKYKLDYSDKISEINTQADVILIAVSDSSIQHVVQNLRPGKQIVLHTAGSISIDVFAYKFENYGVFYPLQTFSKDRLLDFNQIPVFIEANNNLCLEKLTIIANKISDKVYFINSEERKVVHIAAVFASNFVNHLYTISSDILAKHKLDIDILRPLILETTQKVLQNHPSKSQTGPARRNDTNVLINHSEVLKQDKKWQFLYNSISNSIVDYYFSKE